VNSYDYAKKSHRFITCENYPIKTASSILGSHSRIRKKSLQ